MKPNTGSNRLIRVSHGDPNLKNNSMWRFGQPLGSYVVRKISQIPYHEILKYLMAQFQEDRVTHICRRRNTFGYARWSCQSLWCSPNQTGKAAQADRVLLACHDSWLHQLCEKMSIKSANITGISYILPQNPCMSQQAPVISRTLIHLTSWY